MTPPKVRPWLLAALLIITTLGSGCGRDSKQASAALAQDEAITSVQSYRGSDPLGKECSLQLSFDAANQLLALALTATFKVDYKIPMPLSGLYGIYYWPGEFTTSRNLQPTTMRVDKSWFNQDVVVSGKGKPIFFDVPELTQTVTLKDGLAQPTAVTYASTYRVAGVVPVNQVSLDCQHLTLTR